MTEPDPPFEGIAEFRRRDEVAACVRAMIGAARQGIEILSRALDPAVYSHPDITEAITRLARSNRRARVRILLHDNTPLVKDSHRLQLLHQRLSTYIAIHRIPPEHEQFNEAFLVVDGRLWLHQPQADRYEARAAWDQPYQARRLQETFEEIWRESQPDIELRRLGL